MAIDDRLAYNKYESLPNYSYECVKYLIEHNDMIFKLLKYKDADAWKKPNLTQEEKGSLIYGGIGDASKFNIFLTHGMPDVEVDETTLLTISPYMISPDNRTIGTITLMMEVYVNYKITHLSNYTTRLDVIIQQLLETFNGSIVDGVSIGRIHFDKLGTSATRSEREGQLPFSGRWILFGAKTA